MRVSAAEFVRNFALMREKALVEPVVISNHGRETHVLCDAQTFKWHVDSPAGDTAGPEKTGLAARLELANWIDEGIIACDADMHIVFANTLAHNLTDSASGSLAGHALTVALPHIKGGLVETQARRTLERGEVSLVDLPSPFHGDAWLRIHCFRLEDHLVLRMRDVSIEAESRYKANIKEAILEGMEMHGEIAYIRLSARGTIDRVCRPFEAMIGLPNERLKGARLTDLVSAPDRLRVRDALEGVLRDQGPKQVVTGLLTNGGETASVKMAFVHLRGLYGSEGATVICTRLTPTAHP